MSLDKRGKERSLYQTINEEPSKTVQSDAQLADIHEILRNFGQTGMVQHLAKTEAQFMDVTGFEDYRDVMDHVRLAEESFMKLPSKVRELFGHDVSNWLDAAHDQDKGDQIVDKIGEAEAAVAALEAARELVAAAEADEANAG